MTAMTGANGRHARFRELAATALDFPLAPAEAAELAAHLATCPACARLAGALRFDAAALRRPAELPTSYRLDTAVGAAIAGRRAPGQASRTLLLVAATALLGAALLGAAAVGAYLWRTMNPPLLVVDPSPPVVAPSPDPSGEPGPAIPALTWAIGSIPPMVAGLHAEPAAVGGGDGGFVAVGGRFFLDNATPSGATASAWHSADGLAWTPATIDEGLALGGSIPMDDEPQPGIADVARGPAGWVAVGIDMDNVGNRIGAAWSSPDGVAWTRLAFPDAARVRPAAVAWTGSTYVIVGVVREEAAPRLAAWRSTDGRTWARVPDGDAFEVGGWIQYYSASGSGGLADIAIGPDGSLVAVGHACEGTTSAEQQAPCRPIVLRSPDGESWSVVDGDATTGIGLSSVATVGSRFVAIAGGPGALRYVQAPGQVTANPDAAQVAVGDGAGWRLVEPPGVPPLDRIVAFGGRYLAVSSAGNRIRLWSSPDGEAWTEVPGVLQPNTDAADPEIAPFSDVDLAVAGNRVVITGWNQADPAGPTAFAIVGTSSGATGPAPTPSAAPSEAPGLEVGVLTPVSLGPNGGRVPVLGERPPALDAGGTVVAFEAGSRGSGSAVMVRDLGSGTTTYANVDPAGKVVDYTTRRPSISADGRRVAFDSWNADLVAGDTNEVQDVFVRDLATGITVRASVASDGSEAAEGGSIGALSGDGSAVAFASGSPDLVPGDTNGRRDIFVRDLATGETSRVSVGPGGRQSDGDSTQPAVSTDGRVVAFYSAATNLVPGDTNGKIDLFVHDRTTGETTRLSVASDGTQGNDDAGPATSCVSGPDATNCSPGSPPALSGDGQLVVFASEATNLVAGDTNGVPDVFLHDRATGATTLVSRPADGTPADGMSDEPVISADGTVVAFTSDATNLVAGDVSGVLGDGVGNVFVLDRRTGSLYRASSSPSGQATGGSKPALSPDGTVLAFITADDVPGVVALRLRAPDR